MSKQIAIKIGNSQELSKVIQDLLFSKGYAWPTGNTNFEDGVVRTYGDRSIITLNDGKRLLYGSQGSVSADEFEFISAGTEFGKLIKALETPPVPVIKVKNTNGDEYTADFGVNDVVFGCATISNELLRFLNSAPKSFGRKSVTSVNIGAGVFPAETIKAIVEHPHFGKGTSK